MKRIFSISLFIFTCFLVACEEDVEDGLNAPVLEARGAQSDRFSFAVTIKDDGVNGKMYYLVETSDKPQPNAQEIKSKPYANVIDLKGENFKTASMPGLASKTSYTLYAIIAVDNQLSKVASLKMETK